MILHNDRFFSIYFGGKNDCCAKSNFNATKKFLLSLKYKLNLKAIILPRQSHTNLGICILDSFQLSNDLFQFDSVADFLATNLPNVGIAILTADCLPIVFYDPRNLAVAVIHAGWKGSISLITKKAIDMMCEKFGTKRYELLVYFGPCAKSCCYEVDKTFLSNLKEFFYHDCVTLKKGKIFFSLTNFNKLLLIDYGVLSKNMYMQYNLCTICSKKFHSYRSDCGTDYRQVTLVVLKV